MDSIAGSSHHRVDGLFDLSRFEGDCVFFFDLEAVLRRAKSRWLNDRDRLKTICERQVRNVAPQDLLVFSSGGFFLISASGAEADAHIRAGQVNLGLLQLFFGAESLSTDQMVTMFRSATPEEVRSANPHFKMPKRAQEAAEGEKAPPVIESLQFAFAPVEDFRTGRTSTLFCMPFRRTAFGTLYGYRALSDSLRDSPAFDLQALDHSVALTRRLIQASLYAAVGASVGYETLSRPRWRRAYQEKLREMQAIDNPLLLLKIDAIPVGITASRLADLIHCLKPCAKRIFVHLPERTMPLSQTGLLGASGFVFSLSRGLSPDQVTEETNRLIRFSVGQGALSSIDNIETHNQWDLVRAAGARFGAWAPNESNTLNAEAQLSALAGESVAVS
jgi:hypothetical protein